MTPGETDNPQGDELTPSGNEGQTPEENQTLTKKEADAEIARAVQAVRTDVGRLTAELRRSQSIADAAISRLREREDEDYRRQEEQAKDDPDEISRIRRRRLDAERQIKLEERETKVKTQMDRLLQVSAKALSTQYNVSTETLLRYAGEDAEAMEELAKSYGERKAGDSTKGQTTRMTQQPDDGKTKGGGAGLTRADIQKMSPEEQNRRTKDIAALKF